jgi:GNAT superfamily N-acetyltransferase
MSLYSTSLYTIRPAQTNEAELLTGIALRSKAYWGYSTAFMEAAVAEMTVTPGQLAVHTVYVLDYQSAPRGFYQLRRLTAEQVELTDLFLDPSVIGKGWGRALWQHAVDTARVLGYTSMTWESDPYAEGFYLRMGAQRVGEVESSVKPGRWLPHMSYRLVPEKNEV